MPHEVTTWEVVRWVAWMLLLVGAAGICVAVYEHNEAPRILDRLDEYPAFRKERKR